VGLTIALKYDRIGEVTKGVLAMNHCDNWMTKRTPGIALARAPRRFVQPKEVSLAEEIAFSASLNGAGEKETRELQQFLS